uniref:Uncharacterized protein n=1 Tax=Fagus sylvatica TaxID=28930 RepID=A0A2N9HCF7_FAGSY
MDRISRRWNRSLPSNGKVHVIILSHTTGIRTVDLQVRLRSFPIRFPSLLGFSVGFEDIRNHATKDLDSIGGQGQGEALVACLQNFAPSNPYAKNLLHQLLTLQVFNSSLQKLEDRTEEEERKHNRPQIAGSVIGMVEMSSDRNRRMGVVWSTH